MSEQAAAATVDQQTAEANEAPTQTQPDAAGKLYETSEETQGQSVQGEGNGSVEQPVESASSEEGTDDSGDVTQDYEDFSYPDGIEVDTQLLDTMKPIFKGLDLNQEGAQTIIDGYIQALQGQQKAQQDAFAQMEENWMQDLNKDPEFEGPKLDRAVDRITRMIGRFDKTGEAQKLFNHPGVGNHPGLIRMLNELSKVLSEDDFVAEGDATPAAGKTVADRMYPKTAK